MENSSTNSNNKTDFESLCFQAREYLSDKDLSILEDAYLFAKNIYGSEALTANEQILDHQLHVASIIASMRLDLETLQAALLGRTIGLDSNINIDVIKEKFGKGVSTIVESISRISAIQFNPDLNFQAEKVRKMFLAMSADIRVLLVLLADRLHDMRVMDIPDRQKRSFAWETLDLYAPLSSRLGVDWMKRELEDLSFSYIYPEEYEALVSKIESSLEDRTLYVEEVQKILSRMLTENGIPSYRILGRPKHLYSIFRKLMVQDITLDKVYDKVAFRIILNEVGECYEALGHVHGLWKPIDGRFKDFISSPKSNMYQSLHTSVVGPAGNFIEIQIRTEEMDKIAQEGIAAHWAYKEGKSVSQKDAEMFQWMKQLVHWMQELKDPTEFMDVVKGELQRQDIYVLTPNGEVKELPRDSSPLDFAYAIHTEVGNRCIGAKINGKLLPLKTPLHNGDIVEILTSSNQSPNRGWLTFVKTNRAKNRIRNWLRQDELIKSVKVGEEICERELRKHKLSLKKLIKTGHLKEILKKAGSNALEDLLSRVGSGKITTNKLEELLLPPEIKEGKKAEEDLAGKFTVSTHGSKKPKSGDAIVIDGINDILAKISLCCMPMPGDDIIGFITTGRGISVHKTNCRNLEQADPARLIDVNWSSEATGSHLTQLQVTAHDKKGLLVTLCNSITTDDANILHVDAHTDKNNVARLNIKVEVTSLDHLAILIKHLRDVDGVLDAKRI
jgi:GTP diphosphokinase / guanosine-3',5'-bis(diphosphate) 3'-diphosphatase